MTVIFEGLDNTGKSTQIEKLISTFKDRIFHKIHYGSVKGLSSTETEDYSKRLYTDAFRLITEAENTDRNLVFDRCHLGEMVYGKIYRNYEADWVFDLEKDYNDLFLFVLIDEPENVLSREDGLSLSQNENINLAIKAIKYETDRFKLAYKNSNIKNKMLININNLDIDQVHDIILNKIKEKI